MVYFLLQRKIKSNINKHFVCYENSLLEPKEIVIDFEKAAISAFKSEFPTATIKGCFSHFAQANWRKIQEL